MTRVMLTGTHGIGKSATAMKLNSVLPDYLYIPSFAGAVAKRMGFDLNKPHSLKELLAYQDRVLNTFIESYKATAFVDTIYDRSPNDIAAYFVTGLRKFGMNEHDVKAVAFVNRCMEATAEYCDILIYPEADFSQKMEEKFNRPTGEDYNRENFDKLIDYYVCRLEGKVKIIDVPMEYQYDDRVNFILESMGKCQPVMI